jgi:TolB protein
MKPLSTLLTTWSLVLILLLAGCGGDNPADSGDDGNDDTEDTTPPSAPGGLEGTSGDEQVELIWDANGEDDLDGYNLYRATESFSDVSNMDPVNGSSLLSSNEYTDTGLENGTTYYYRVTAVDENENEGSTSSEVEITPFSDPPDRPD